MENAVHTPADFNAFWDATLGELDAVAPEAICELDVEWSTPDVTVEHVRLLSLGGVQIHGWLFTPQNTGVAGAVLHLPGYSGMTYDRAWMVIYRQLAGAGLVLLSLDPRGQGASKPVHPPAAAGKLLTGIDSPQNHIYRGILADCVQGVRFLAHHTGYQSVGVAGISQGGGLALMTAALAAKQVGAVTAMLPFLTNYRMQVALRPAAGPYREITAYIDAYPEQQEQVLSVLDYFDTMTHARRIQAPALLSLGLADATCPAESIRSLFAELSCVKSLICFPEMGHVNSPEFYHHVVQWHKRYLDAAERTLADLRLHPAASSAAAASN